jgi:hypothetical protein
MWVQHWSARQLILTLHEVLLAVGEEVGSLWFVVVGLAILLGFPVVGALVSLQIGFWTADLFGWGDLFALLMAFVFGLFLAIYVWDPYVRSPTHEVCETIARRRRGPPEDA